VTTTLIAKRTRVGGRIDTHGDVVVEGRVEGTIVAAGCVTIGVTGVAVSDILATRAVVLGIVIGNIEASERIDVAGSARIVGDIRSPSISLASPATVEGRVEQGVMATLPPEAVAVAGQVTIGTSVVPGTRPTLRIRGAALVRPAKPDSGNEPAVPKVPSGDHAPARPRREPGPVPLPPRPPSRARMLPHASRDKDEQ
jgi:cytoskeletal protein CcmA (bactofilin family)